MTQDEMKKMVARAALDYVETGTIIGIGTGSTANHFIDHLAGIKGRIDGTVASSQASADRLAGHGIPVLDLNSVDEISVYIDGADESDHHLHLIKGGGGALTREKIVAGASSRFVCIVDDSKCVDILGRFPLPVEIVPMARLLIATKLAELGGDARLREGFVTDNGNHILDVHGLRVTEPRALEQALNQIPGVVTVGLFAHRGADVLLVAGDDGVETLHRQR